MALKLIKRCLPYSSPPFHNEKQLFSSQKDSPSGSGEPVYKQQMLCYKDTPLERMILDVGFSLRLAYLDEKDEIEEDLFEILFPIFSFVKRKMKKQGCMLLILPTLNVLTIFW